MPRPVRESLIEKYLTAQAKKRKFYCRKWASPGQRGVPDRLLLKDGLWVAIECKRPGGKPTPLQQIEHRILDAHGGLVFVVDTKEKVDEVLNLIEEICHDQGRD